MSLLVFVWTWQDAALLVVAAVFLFALFVAGLKDIAKKLRGKP